MTIRNQRKRIMPTSLFGRSLLIVVLPLLLLQTVSMFIFYNSHWEDVGRRLALGLGGEIAMLAEAVARYPDGIQRDWILYRAQANLSMRVRVLGNDKIPEG